MFRFPVYETFSIYSAISWFYTFIRTPSTHGWVTCFVTLLHYAYLSIMCNLYEAEGYCEIVDFVLENMFIVEAAVVKNRNCRLHIYVNNNGVHLYSTHASTLEITCKMISTLKLS